MEYKYIYGPVPSRRLGRSLGVAPIPAKTCSYSCVYCQLGRTKTLTSNREMYFPKEDILEELRHAVRNVRFDIISIVGDGEPTLYAGLGSLIADIKTIACTPVAIITNGSLLYDRDVQREVGLADIVLPSLDAYDERSFRRINRPGRGLDFRLILSGLKHFSQMYKGKLWLEVMIVAGLNDSDEALSALSAHMKDIRYDRLYINTPIRPPAEAWVRSSAPDIFEKAASILGGISIDAFSPISFQSSISDDYDAIISIIGRHAMRREEIAKFLIDRGNKLPEDILKRLENDDNVEKIYYGNTIIYRNK